MSLYTVSVAVGEMSSFFFDMYMYIVCMNPSSVAMHKVHACVRHGPIHVAMRLHQERIKKSRGRKSV